MSRPEGEYVEETGEDRSVVGRRSHGSLAWTCWGGRGEDGEEDEDPPGREVGFYRKDSEKLLMGFLAHSQRHDQPGKKSTELSVEENQATLSVVPSEK